MKHHGNQDHPEVQDIYNICHIAPNSKEAKAICKKIDKEEKKINHIKKDYDLDEALEETFPASDATAKY